MRAEEDLGSFGFVFGFWLHSQVLSAAQKAAFVWSWAGILLNFMVLLSKFENDTPSRQSHGSSSGRCLCAKKMVPLLSGQVQPRIRHLAG